MPRLTKIYTRGGDRGTTALGSGRRVPKESLRVSAYGTVDELNSYWALLSLTGCVKANNVMPIIQNELFHLGSDLCFNEEEKVKYSIPQN